MAEQEKLRIKYKGDYPVRVIFEGFQGPVSKGDQILVGHKTYEELMGHSDWEIVVEKKEIEKKTEKKEGDE